MRYYGIAKGEIASGYALAMTGKRVVIAGEARQSCCRSI